MYAINIADLTKDDILKSFLILPVCTNKKTVNVDKKRLDEMAVILECPDEQSIAIVEVIRKKYSKNLFRCYESKTGKNWKRI
jgi:hypothetical protein